MEFVSAACSRTGFPCLQPSVLLPHPCTRTWLLPGLTDYADLIWMYLGWWATIQCTQLSTYWNWRGSSLRWQWPQKKFLLWNLERKKVKYISHSNILRDHKHGFSSMPLIAVVINSAPTACCPLEVSSIHSKVHWLSCEVWHPRILYKCPGLLPLLYTKAGRAEWAWVRAGDASRAVSAAFHGQTYCSLPTKTADWKNCWLLPLASPPVNCEKSQKPQMEVLKCHHVHLLSMSTNSRELLRRHKDTLFNWQVTSVRFVDLSKIWSDHKWKRQSSDERMRSRVNLRGSESLWRANVNLKLAPPTPLLCFLSPSQTHRCMSLV